MKQVVISGLLACGFAFAQDCEAGFKSITHELGTSCVPERVERVVTLENSMTEAVVTLGVQPVGVADIDLYKALVNLPLPLSEDAVDVGSRQEPNLELITELDPDLIIGASWRMGETYDELSAIAPTLAFVGSESLVVMADFLNAIALALGREGAAEAALGEMERAFDEAGELVSASDTDKGFVLSQTWFEDDQATFRLFTDNAMPVEILEAIGLENRWRAAPEPDGFSVVGIEALGDVRDTNFLYLTDPESAPFYAESPVWNSLPFVEADSAYRLNDDLWLFGGPLSAERFVDAVLETLGVADAN